ncbi:MAG: hypothetical protein GMKNLPBB_00054 [Myxococcota bacterium]|nr:hypothetical protein [Myxococcota bacterium]
MKFLWGAYLFITVNFGFLAFIIRESRQTPPPPLPSFMLPLFAAMAAVFLLLIPALSPLLAKRTSYQTWCVVRWACAESAAAIGLAHHIIGGEHWTLIAFLGAAWVCQWRMRPGESSECAYNQLRKAN